MANYWYKVCPRCDGQGRLVIAKNLIAGKLFFWCDECERAWYDELFIGSKDKVFLGVDVNACYAEEIYIAEGGW